MKKTVTKPGEYVEMACSVCEVEEQHLVVTATKLGVVTQASCEKCNTVTTFSRGLKTAVALGKGKNAAPYDRSRSYRTGQAMMHHVFGRGEVTAVVGAHKIDVLFGDKTRRMIHEVSDWK